MWRFYYTIGRNLFRLPKLISTMRYDADHPEQYSEEKSYEYIRYIVGLMQRTGHIRTEGFGMENLPEEGGYMMYPNHQGMYDAYSIVSVHDKPCTVVMDQAKSHWPFIREVIDSVRGKRLHLTDTRQALTVIKEITQEVIAGRRYILFPEGGFTNDKKNQLREFKSGCFRISLKSKTPIVPVVLMDTYKPFNSWELTPVTTQVHFLEPIYYESYKDMNTAQISEMVKERIRRKIEEIEMAQRAVVMER